jgi:hypothetical protein
MPTHKVQFRDAAIYINSSVDGQLDIVADTEIQIAATTTVDINGAVDVSGTLGVTGVATLASLVATTADINAGTIDGTVIGGTTAAAGSFTTGAFSGEIAANGGIALGDNDKATFGDGDDLQIYHSGTHSYIKDAGTGNLNILASTSINLLNGDSSDYMARFNENGSNQFFYDGDPKLTTTSTGIDVTGTVTATGTSVFASLDISGNIDVDGTTNLDVVDIDGATQIDATVTVGVDDTGYDVKFFGATAGAYMLWDESADDLILGGAAGLSVNSTALVTGVLTTTAATVFNGGFAAGGVGTFADGSNSAPSLTNTGDLNTGLYFPAADEVGLTVGGTQRLNVSATGIDVTGTATMDGLTVSGNVNIADAIPILRLDSPAVAWAGGEDLGGIDWYTEDASGDGPMVMARLVANSIGANTLPLPEFTFQTSLSSSALIDRLKIHNGGDISFYEDTGTTAKFFWDASEEILGIGTSSPTIGGGLTLSSSTTTQGFIDFKHTVDGDSGFIGNAKALIVGGTTNQLGVRGGTSGIAFSVGSAEAARIDSSGNLLVGKTAVDFSVDGVALQPSGIVGITRDGGAPLILNRKTSDGDIAIFQKDGAPVGSIGSSNSSSVTYLAGSASGGGIGVANNSPAVFPARPAGVIDDTINLGSGSYRFKNLYLSVGVVFGDAGGSGTSTSNTLDSYEEGTWTPALVCGTSGTLDVSTTRDIFSYTKIGNTVHVQGMLSIITATSPLGSLRLTGMPFVTSGSGEFSGRSAGSIYTVGLTGSVNVLQLSAVESATELVITEFDGATTLDDVANHMQGGNLTSLTIGFTYQTT